MKTYQRLALVLLNVGAFGAFGVLSNAAAPSFVQVASLDSPQALSALQHNFPGVVLNIRPPAAVCHQPEYDAAKCAEVISSWNSSTWRSDQIGAMQTTTWEQRNGQWCDIPLNGSSAISTPCTQGNIPRFGINASTAEDISKVVKVANLLHLPLVIKNTGHDYLGRSTDPNRLLIWTHNLKDISFGDANICGKAQKDTVTVGAGLHWGEVYKYLGPHNRVVPGGADPNVGASGGQTLGGGHSPLGNTYGLTPDSVLEFEVVTLGGTISKVNECENSDLFWALRGGGGGTYAIVTSTTYKTYADAPMAFAFWNYTDVPSAYAPSFAALAKYTPDLTKMGWSGYFYGSAGTFYGFCLLPLINNKSMEEATASFQPFFKDLNATKGLTYVFADVSPVPSFQHIVETTLTAQPTGYRGLLGSRLIPRKNMESDASREELGKTIAAIRDDSQQIGIIGHLVAGGAVSNLPKVESAVLPAWREAIWHLVLAVSPPADASKQQLDATFSAITERLEPLRKITPGGGAYMNEADARAPEWKKDFFGSNYDRLLMLKNKYDRKRLLKCNKCVGSDHEWR